MVASLILSFAVAAAPGPATDSTTDWREFRGPDGTGHYAGPKLVTEWGVDKNVKWKVPVPGKGWSSPILVGDKLILTTAIPNEDGSQKLHALAFDAKTGQQLWDTELFVAPAKAANKMNSKNSCASPTPVSDGEKVWVFFGHMGLGCLDLAGNVIWKTLKYTYEPMHGNGGSPILVDDHLVFSVDGIDQQYVVALNKENGDEVWKTDRKSKALFKFTFSTPQLITANGRRMIVSPASDFVAAYDPKSGSELWRAKYPKVGWSVITRPVFPGAGLRPDRLHQSARSRDRSDRRRRCHGEDCLEDAEGLAEHADANRRRSGVVRPQRPRQADMLRRQDRQSALERTAAGFGLFGFANPRRWPALFDERKGSR